MNPEVTKLNGSPRERRMQEYAAALAVQCAGYVEYVAMMCDVELPEDEAVEGNPIQEAIND